MKTLLHATRVLHRNHAGGSWRSKTMKFGGLCAKGEQMVQIHEIVVQNVPVMYANDRFHFVIIEEAIVSPRCNETYIK